jgi:hypothetical protein
LERDYTTLDHAPLEAVIRTRRLVWRGHGLAGADAVRSSSVPLFHFLQSLHAGDREFSVTDPLDRTYGLLALAHSADRLEIKVDYDLSVETVYIKDARSFIQRGNQLGQPTTKSLNLCRSARNTSSQNLPSWVMDWRTNVRPWFHGRYFDLQQNLFRRQWVGRHHPSDTRA